MSTLLEGTRRERIRGAGCDLSVLTTGPEDGQPVVLLHGMRDHAVSMTFAVPYLQECRLIMPDLRGHGDSENPGHYGLFQFVSDLQAVYRHYDLSETWLAGHSLGGHIVSRFSSLYPGSVKRLAVLDGMGPPSVDRSANPALRAARAEQWRMAIDRQLEEPSDSRVMVSQEDAQHRLLRNNPGLSPEVARLLSTTGVKAVEGGVAWKWDPRVDMMWTSFSVQENEAAWSDIPCPVLVVTGEHSLSYWKAARFRSDHDPEALEAFYQSELKRRAAIFQDASSLVIEGAGHMIHYDQPERLGRTLQAFFTD